MDELRKDVLLLIQAIYRASVAVTCMFTVLVVVFVKMAVISTMYANNKLLIFPLAAYFDIFAIEHRPRVPKLFERSKKSIYISNS